MVLFRYLSCLLCKIWIRMEIRPSKDSSEIPRIGQMEGDREGMREKEGGGERPLVGNLLEEVVNSQPGLPDVRLPPIPSSQICLQLR